MPESAPEFQRICAFLSAFARRQARRTVELPGGFAAFDDEVVHSYADNHIVIDGTVLDPAALPALADDVAAHLPFRHITVLDDETGQACAPHLVAAGYLHHTYVVMAHRRDVPPAAPDAARAGIVDLDALREPLAASWRGFLPDADEEVIRQLVDRRAARLRGAERVHFLGSRTADRSEVAGWVDLYLDPAAGIAQIEDLVTNDAHRGQGHAGAVLTEALRLASDAGCRTRFLIAELDDWPRHWYERRGFTTIGRQHCFERH